MSESVSSPQLVDHPLLADRPRLERITDNMSVQIQRKIYGAATSPDVERALHGGVSVDDVLQEALLALLTYDPRQLNETWESLSVGIARKKAVDAVRHSTKGRRGRDQAPDEPDEIRVVALDAFDSGEGVEPASARAVVDADDAEGQFLRAEQQRVILRLARDLLSDRDKAVFFGIHYLGRTRADLAREVGLTPQGVGQLYVRLAKQLYEQACQDPAFGNDQGPNPEGGPHD
jgi:RNA polymerase sigma factor (sigma-70 family)